MSISRRCNDGLKRSGAEGHRPPGARKISRGCQVICVRGPKVEPCFLRRCQMVLDYRERLKYPQTCGKISAARRGRIPLLGIITRMTTVSRMWNESDDRKYAAFYMEKLRRGEDAFFGLIEGPGGSSVVPILIEEFRRDADPKVRKALIRVISEFRLRSSVPFFAEALRDASPLVWKAALDAFFAVPCAESLAALESVGESVQDKKQRSWFSEAIDQLREQLAKDENA
ncbi:MAG: hypothetical protein JWR69_4583 [Pedosphaera sp.]|nr:hypothetical protein [Pedosphaera sp.]